MRRQLVPSVVRFFVFALALVLGGSPAFADDRTQARTHYQAGVKFYGAGDYRSAIREFSAAQQLAPADLNNYNLALCYDKLGDPEPAVQYYRAYLDKVPNTDKRAEIEASIVRLDTAAKSAAAKKAEEARKIEEARLAAEAKRAAEEMRKAEAARKAEEAKRPDTASEPLPDPNVGGGSTGTPGTGVVSTGDAQLDRVQSIDINGIRDQRVGGAASGIPADPARGPAVAANGNVNASAGAGVPPTVGPNGQAQGAPPVGPQDQPKKADPVYKKWWFWVIVGVSAIVVYNIATEDSQDNIARTMLPIGPAASPQQSGGVTLMSW